METLNLLKASPFFETIPEEYLEALVPLGEVQGIKQDEWLFQEGGDADHLYLLVKGSIKLVFAGPSKGSAPAPSIELRNITEPGRAIGWSALVRPHRYHAGAVANEDSQVLKFNREDLIQLCSDDPEFGIRMMQRILWVLGNRLRSSRIRLVVQKYHQEILAIRSLLDQSAETLEVTSPLHKIPYYLENRLTISDAFDVLNLVQAHGNEEERNIARLCLEILKNVQREIKIYQSLQTIYEHVANAPPSRSPQEIRNDCCREFINLFNHADYLIQGEDHLPNRAGNIFIMNHIMNNPENQLPNDFQLNLDTHFVSSKILFKKYGEAPIRVVRKSYLHEYAHKKYYDRLGYIYVEGEPERKADAEKRPTHDKILHRFLEAATSHLKAGRNVSICPEGNCGPTEGSPTRIFRPGAFRLAAFVQPEPWIVPIAVANFDKKLSATRLVAVVHSPFKLSEVLADPNDNDALYRFCESLREKFKSWVREAVALAEEKPR